MFALSRRFAQIGLLGLNERNINFIAAYNSRSRYPLVDDKVLTKDLAQRAGLTVPELFFTIEIQHQTRNLAALLRDHNDFVLKPARGSGGEGVLVISGRMKDNFRASGGDLYSLEELSYYISRVLSGVFSLGGHPDKAICEYRVKYSSVFEKITYLGVPDVRIIVFQGVPVMSMVRLPTRGSQGKANLHQGAIGAGISIATGTTLSAVWRNEIVTEHPDTGSPVSGLKIPGWTDLLTLAAKSYELTGLGYIGADIVLDQDKGPMLLELNARPGLNIQLANQAGLLPRLKKTAQASGKLKTLKDRVAFARENFG